MPIDSAGLRVAVLWLAAITSVLAVVVGAIPSPNDLYVNSHKSGRYGDDSDNVQEVECCPSILEMTQPQGGKTQEDMYVELYGEGKNRQRFYEKSCKEGVVGKPCRFIDRRHHNMSRCEQKYSYSYAIVRYPPGSSPQSASATMVGDDDDIGALATGTLQPDLAYPAVFPAGSRASQGKWVLDYIRIRSGCGCVVVPTKRHSKKARNRNRDDNDWKSNDKTKRSSREGHRVEDFHPKDDFHLPRDRDST